MIKFDYNRAWDTRHAKILVSILYLFEKENIRNFIIRNYEGLPEKNSSKDVDIIVEPGKIKQAISILKKVYKENGLVYFYKVQYEHGHNCKGMNIETNMTIHVDLMEGYFSRGAELFSFDELYNQTIVYKDFRVLNEFYTGLMVFIYKQFGYKKPKLKQEYRDIIYNTYKSYPEFENLISKLIGAKLSANIFIAIEQKDFDGMLAYSSQLTKALTRYAFRKKPIETFKNRLLFYSEKMNRIVFNYHKFSKVFSVIAPDGAGKTTFLDALMNKIAFYYVDDQISDRCHLYHFRPNLLPNLGELGEKSGIKKQDKDFTNPHRAKPASVLSSLIRISYYWLDYVVGYNLFVRKDVKVDKYSIFDRYSYDLIVDPLRIRLKLPLWVRKTFVMFMPHPKIVFYLHADPDVIYKRKQELTLDEIMRQNIEYKNVATSHKRFIVLDSNRSINEIVDDALKIILDTYTEKLQ